MENPDGYVIRTDRYMIEDPIFRHWIEEDRLDLIISSSSTCQQPPGSWPYSRRNGR